MGDDDDAAARRKRAELLREQIGQLTGRPPAAAEPAAARRDAPSVAPEEADGPGPSGAGTPDSGAAATRDAPSAQTPSPREFIEQRMRELARPPEGRDDDS
jgi:hypothetical protein